MEKGGKMNFLELVEEVRDRLSQKDVSHIPGVLAFQFDITGKAAGTFYVEVKDGILSVEPYEYYDRHAIFTLNGSNLKRLMSGKLDPVAAFTSGKIKIDGDTNKAMELVAIIKQN